MTATAIEGEVSCPKCGSGMYDNRATKKNPKQPDFKCKRYKEGCDGVIWPPKGFAPKAAAPKPRLETAPYPPNVNLPGEGEEDRELAARIGFDRATIQKDLSLYQSITEWTLGTIEPIYRTAEIGLSGTDVKEMVATLFINITGGKK